ncbi:ribosome-inactivating family protein [Kitasatospora sp. NPDC018058]|uniref:ribosome-inactivating family protein n=1 Tax=Kitasatospora sp. NPDC018058 TaxID=3364025 RepID=UPI0037C12E3D
MLRKLALLLLSLATAMGLVTGLSTTASATNFSVIDWNISNITERGATHESNYYRLISAIHLHTYGNVTHYEGLTQTSTDHDRLVQVRVLDTNNTQLTSVYLWADNLYVAGFYAPATNTHFAFNDRYQDFQTALGIPSARILPTNGNYTGLPGGNDRGRLVLEPETIYNAMYQLGHAAPNDYNDAVGRALVVAIQIFSEASRFSPILDRIRGNIHNWTHTPLTDDYAGLENDWGRISQFAYNIRNNPTLSIRILGQWVTSLVGLSRVLGFVELNGSQARL